MIVEQALGSEHESVGTGLNNLAVNLYAQGKYFRAEPFFLWAPELQEKVFDEEHVDKVFNYACLGVLYTTQGKYAQAEAYLKQA